MGQALIRHLDDDLLAAYRDAAKEKGRSLESELRDALARARPMTRKRSEDLLELSRRLRAMTPTGIEQTPSEAIIRAFRDGKSGV